MLAETPERWSDDGATAQPQPLVGEDPGVDAGESLISRKGILTSADNPPAEDTWWCRSISRWPWSVKAEVLTDLWPKKNLVVRLPNSSRLLTPRCENRALAPAHFSTHVKLHPGAPCLHWDTASMAVVEAFGNFRSTVTSCTVKHKSKFGFKGLSLLYYLVN